MKKLIFTFLMSVISLSVFSQITLSADTTFKYNFPMDGVAHGSTVCIVTNTGTTTAPFTWTKGFEGFPAGWTGIGICDSTCYTYATKNTNTVNMAPGATINLYVDVKALSTAPIGPAYVTLNTNAGPITFHYQGNPASTANLEFNSIVNIFPNPATNFVNIDIVNKSISNINVVNIVGKKIARFTVDRSTPNPIFVPLDNISSGIYLLQFTDEKGKLLGVKRVTKQ